MARKAAAVAATSSESIDFKTMNARFHKRAFLVFEWGVLACSVRLFEVDQLYVEYEH